MKPNINLSRDGKLIQVFIPAQLGRHSGRKTILSPTGQPVNPDRNTEADVTLINAVVRAHRWNRWLVKGRYASVKEIAADEGITSASYASRILRLVLLAPDIQEAIINSTHPANLTLADFMDPFPQIWELQQKKFGFKPHAPTCRRVRSISGTSSMTARKHILSPQCRQISGSTS